MWWRTRDRKCCSEATERTVFVMQGTTRQLTPAEVMRMCRCDERRAGSTQAASRHGCCVLCPMAPYSGALL